MPARTPRRRTGLLVALVLLVALAAWTGWNALQGGRELLAARDDLTDARSRLTQGQDARDPLRRAAAHTEAARDGLEDPVVRAVGAVPFLGAPLRSATSIARASDLAVRSALLPLATAAGEEPSERLLRGAGSVDIDYLAGLAAPAARASAALAQAQEELTGAPRRSRVGRIDRARSELDEQLADLTGIVDDVTLTSRLAPTLLGRGQVRRYLVVSQSPAEARGTGGLIGGFTLLEADEGTLRVVRSGPRSELASPGTSVIDLGEEYDDHYGLNGPTLGWINSNLSPHLPYAGQIWQELWERQYGEQLDGAVLLDPVALSYLLEATGPVPVLDGQVGAGDVVDATLRDVYARFDDDPSRDRYLQAVSSGVATALTTRPVPGRVLVEALERAADERRLLLWLAEPGSQSALSGRDVSGTFPQGRVVGDVLIDGDGGKLDYYLERRLDYRQGCSEPSRLRLMLTNTAPAEGLPEYVTPIRTRPGLPEGTDISNVNLYLPGGSSIRGVTVDGAPAPNRSGTELGAVWVETRVETRPGARSEVLVEFDEPAPTGPVTRLAQPLVRPEEFTASTC